jgi:ABC-type glycerol-3-phosphate transport system substrate-binding protein
MAGRGPDIALTVGRTLPVDLGVRGSLHDLSQFEGFEDIRARFQKTAFNAYTFKGKVYAIPETQEFNMMFVRSDILDEFGITVPKTWEELFQLLSAFSQQNMLVGIPPAILGTLLAQNGMNYYEPSFQKTVFSSNEAYKVYEEFAKIYRDYEMPYAYDAGNRFRVGEMPVVIASFSFFNTISVLAPEIRGSWDMYEVPGTVKPDGSIDNSVDASGASTVMFKACEDPLAGMEFIEWWSSAESQSRYGIELENILGPSGRYSTANIEAFASLNWSNTQHKKIAAQRENVKEIPEVPGGYIIARNINNLFIDTIANRNNIRESLLRYSRIMDEELMRKQTELEAYSQGEE